MKQNKHDNIFRTAMKGCNQVPENKEISLCCFS